LLYAHLQRCRILCTSPHYEAIGAKYKAVKHETMTEEEPKVWERSIDGVVDPSTGNLLPDVGAAVAGAMY
jgi:hypothetical protein